MREEEKSADCRPQYAVFPGDEGGYTVDDQYYIGDSGLLFKPVVFEGATSTEVYLADDQVNCLSPFVLVKLTRQPYYDYFSSKMYPRWKSPRSVSIETPLSSFPLLLQGGNIIPIRQRVRRSSPLMWQDPFTLIISLSKEGTALGKLYLDDGVGYDYEKGEYVLRQFEFASNTLRSISRTNENVGDGNDPNQARNNWAQVIGHVRIERIIILGLKSEPKSVRVGGSVVGHDVEYTWEKGMGSDSKKGGNASRLTLKNPGVNVVEDWAITLA